MLALHGSLLHAWMQSRSLAHAGGGTQPASSVQYVPEGHAVVPLLGPIVCEHVPLDVHESIVHEKPSSQSVALAQCEDPPAPADPEEPPELVPAEAPEPLVPPAALPPLPLTPPVPPVAPPS